MKEILIFAGTTEGRMLSEYLASLNIHHTICVATEYGEIVLKKHSLATVHQGRMNQEEIKDFLANGKFLAVIDATHSYAKIVTQNIKAAAVEMKLPYFRLLREYSLETDYDNVHYFDTSAACAQALALTEGNILLTTGSNELSTYCISEEIKRRLFVRVLPSTESIVLCNQQGIYGKHIIAIQGPFNVEMNEAILKQYDISCLVTKESGTVGGFLEKIDAAKRTGASVFVIGCPKEENGYSFPEICRALEKICGKCFPQKAPLQITLAGIGMGGDNGITKEVASAIDNADILLGAQRLIAPYHAKSEKHSIYRAEQIIPYLKEIHDKKVVVLFSGDSGFYSGCQALYNALEQEIQTKNLNASIRILPGISSVSYLAACINESYQDAAVYSMHGKELRNLAHRIKTSQKTFLLMSGVNDVNLLGTLLLDAKLADCEIIVGYQLSYPNQQIQKLTPQECCALKAEGLYTCFIHNPNAIDKKSTHGIADTEFIRSGVPMTKEEVREVSICKLHLHERAVIYDIGSGTGSVAVEIASLSNDIHVYAIEQKKEAVSLILQNKEKFCLQNITVIEAKAPEGLTNLPIATHAFIGGSGGKLKEILTLLQQINPQMQIVINAVSWETICELKELVTAFEIKDAEIVQLQVSRAKQLGNYHLMQSENPIWICAFTFSGNKDKLYEG